ACRELSARERAAAVRCEPHGEEPPRHVHRLSRYGSSKATAPVSSSDLRLDKIFGQPPETASTSFDPSRSTLCVIVSLTACPVGTSSIVHSDAPSLLSSGRIWCSQRITKRRGGSASTISPASHTWPPSLTSFQ